MRNGLYRALFQTLHGSGAGVFYAQDGRIWGGDGGFFYVGTYQSDSDQLTATVLTKRDTDHPGIVSVFGVDEVTIDLVGTVSGDTATCKGSSPQAPGLIFDALVTRVSD